MGVTVQGEHDGLEEEDRSDPEGRGAHGPARPDVRSSGEEEHERTRPGRSRRELNARPLSRPRSRAACETTSRWRMGTLVDRRESDDRTRAAHVLLLALVQFLLAGSAGGERGPDLGLDLAKLALGGLFTARRRPRGAPPREPRAIDVRVSPWPGVALTFVVMAFVLLFCSRANA